MRRYLIRFILWNTLILLPLMGMCRELRGVWVEFTPRSWGKASDTQVRDIIRDLDKNNFNAIFPLARDYSGGMLYTSAYSSTAHATILPVMINEAHKRGIEVHAWMPSLIGGFITPDPVLKQHPDWAVVYKDGKSCLERPIDKCYWWLDPSNPGVREHLKNLAKEMARQGVDGINLDWLRISPAHTWSTTFRDGFRNKYGVDPLTINTPDMEAKWTQYRIEVVTSLASEIRSAAKSVNPKIKISAAVAPDPEECKSARLQDWLAWTDFLDFIFPMLYQPPTPELTAKAKELMAKAKCPVYIGLGGDETRFSEASTYGQLIQYVRESGSKGYSFYRLDLPDKTHYLNRADLEALKKTVNKKRTKP